MTAPQGKRERRPKPKPRTFRIWVWRDQYNHGSVCLAPTEPVRKTERIRCAAGEDIVCDYWFKRLFGFVPRKGGPAIEVAMRSTRLDQGKRGSGR